MGSNTCSDPAWPNVNEFSEEPAMRDPRIEELARILTGYSTAVQPGDVVLISASGIESLPLVTAVHAEALRAGARHVEVELDLPDLRRQFFDLAGAEQLAYFPEDRLRFMREVDVSIGIGAPDNVMTLARADQQKIVGYQKLLHPILEERVKNTRWVVTRFPTSSTPTRAPATSASSPSASTRGFSPRCATFSSMRRFSAPST
jgi:aminopeptidase